MTSTDARARLNQKLDQLPPGVLATVIEFVDFLSHRYKQSPSATLGINARKVDSSDFQNASLTIQSESIDVRPPVSDDSLLDITDTWEGDDFEECLEMVYNSRSQIKA